MAGPRSVGGFAAKRQTVLSVVRLLVLSLGNLPFLRAAPIPAVLLGTLTHAEEPPMSDATLWIYLAVAMGLVLLGGAFAGLTIALMGQDEIYLQVIKTSGDGGEKKNAASVLRLLERGKHWVLVTLLLGNVITNETLPIVLDRSLGGGWSAVLGSTVLIVIFGEIIPQSICVRYGLPIGAWMSPLVLILMYILGPIAWPTAKLLDRLLGEEHGTTYKKAGLKTLVTLHKSLGAAGEQLNSDEVTIISAVLDLKEKSVGSIMTPMDNVFTMSADTVLDEKTMDIILSAGYSRIPIHAPHNPMDFVGMLLVKILITYDPQDCKPVREFALATLPETSPETSCLDIVNYFQEGKSHMVLVTEFPGQDAGALGVVTLEDVIEELIGEEIIDESDVFIDVHKAIRRMTPAPRLRVPKGDVVHQEPAIHASDHEEDLIDVTDHQLARHDAVRKLAANGGKDENSKTRPELASSPKASFFDRRTSSVTGSIDREIVFRRENAPEMREHLKHLGPSNLASRPKQTRYNTVKIKPGTAGYVEVTPKTRDTSLTQLSVSQPTQNAAESLANGAGKVAKDRVAALQSGYGSISETPELPETESRGIQFNRNFDFASNDSRPKPSRGDTSRSQSTVGSLPKRQQSYPPLHQSKARSGSITENIVESGGVRKVVLETTSSSEEGVELHADADGPSSDRKENERQGQEEEPKKSGKKKRRRKRKQGAPEDEPLLGGDE